MNKFILLIGSFVLGLNFNESAFASKFDKYANKLHYQVFIKDSKNKDPKYFTVTEKAVHNKDIIPNPSGKILCFLADLHMHFSALEHALHTSGTIVINGDLLHYYELFKDKKAKINEKDKGNDPSAFFQVLSKNKFKPHSQKILLCLGNHEVYSNEQGPFSQSIPSLYLFSVECNKQGITLENSNLVFPRVQAVTGGMVVDNNPSFKAPNGSPQAKIHTHTITDGILFVSYVTDEIVTVNKAWSPDGTHLGYRNEAVKKIGDILLSVQAQMASGAIKMVCFSAHARYAYKHKDNKSCNEGREIWINVIRYLLNHSQHNQSVIDLCSRAFLIYGHEHKGNHNYVKTTDYMVNGIPCHTIEIFPHCFTGCVIIHSNGSVELIH